MGDRALAVALPLRLHPSMVAHEPAAPRTVVQIDTEQLPFTGISEPTEG